MYIPKEKADKIFETGLLARELCTAVSQGDIAAATALLDQGASPDAYVWWESYDPYPCGEAQAVAGGSEYPLRLALERGDSALARLLLERGAHLRDASIDGSLAVGTGDPDLVRLAFEQGDIENRVSTVTLVEWTMDAARRRGDHAMQNWLAAYAASVVEPGQR